MKQEQVKEHFAKQADAYEALMVRLVPHYLAQHEIIASLLPDDDRGCRVLDLGCGNGVLSELVFQKLPRSRIVGFDLTESMLAAYEKKLAAYRGKFTLKAGDFRTDPIGTGYDIILAGLSLQHLTGAERRAFYRQLFAALNHGGLLVARDIIVDEDNEVATYQTLLWKKFMSAQGEDPEFWHARHLAKDHPVTLADHFQWLKEAGFTKVGCYWRLYNFAVTAAEKR